MVVAGRLRAALRFTIDDHQNVVAFGLELDRNWLDGSALGMRQGGELAERVMASVAAADPILREVADQVAVAALIPPGRVLGFPHNPANPTHNPDIDSFCRTFYRSARGLGRSHRNRDDCS